MRTINRSSKRLLKRTLPANVTLPSGEKSIEIDTEQAPFVVKIFELYAKGNNSFQTVTTKMRAQNFAKTSRGKSVTARTVELILKNPFYMGMMNVKGRLYSHKSTIDL